MSLIFIAQRSLSLFTRCCDLYRQINLQIGDDRTGEIVLSKAVGIKQQICAEGRDFSTGQMLMA
jgi:hypothetical protein